MTLATTVRTNPILKIDLGDHAAFTESRLLTETLAALHEEVRRAGLDPTRTWNEPAGDYSVTLATMPADGDPR